MASERTCAHRPSPAHLPEGVTINSAKMQMDPGPKHFSKLKPGESLVQAGIYDSHFIVYHTKIFCPAATNLLVEYPEGDTVLAVVNGQPVPHAPGGMKPGLFNLPWQDRTRLVCYMKIMATITTEQTWKIHAALRRRA